MGNEEVTALDSEELQLRQDMEDTRSSMTEKLEALESKVTSTVEGAANAVTETVESVKGAVEGTVETVKESFQSSVDAVKNSLDLPLQVERHPWAMMCGSVAIGFVAGRFLGGSSTSTGTSAPNEAVSGKETGSLARKPQKSPGNGWSGKQTVSSRSAGRTDSEPGMLSKLTQQFAPEIEKLKGLAIGSMLGLVRDMIHKATPPEVGSQIAQMIDDVTTKLGGKPISGSVSNFFSQGQSSEEVCPPGQKDSPVGAASFPGRGGFER